MIRAAAKNHDDVAVVVDADDYARVLDELKRTAAPPRWRCASRSRRRPTRAPPPTTRRSPTGSPNELGEHAPGLSRRSAASSRSRCATARTRTRTRRSTARPSSASASRPRGRCRARSSPTTTSTTPTRPTSASRSSIRSARRACVIVKHANPCGVAEGAIAGRGLPQGARAATRPPRSAASSRSTARSMRDAAQRHHRDLHRGHHRAGRDRRSHRDRRREEEPAPAARGRPARSEGAAA